MFNSDLADEQADEFLLFFFRKFPEHFLEANQCVRDHMFVGNDVFAMVDFQLDTSAIEIDPTFFPREVFCFLHKLVRNALCAVLFHGLDAVLNGQRKLLVTTIQLSQF